MHATRVDAAALLTFNALEARLLRQVLQTVRGHYRLQPAELDSALNALWYSTQGCRSAGMSPEETREWVEALHAIKRSNLQLLESALDQLSGAPEKPPRIRLRLDEVPIFLTIINDHRLLSAARGEIGQKEMDLHSFRGINTLKPAQQAALYEIHLLAYVMEELLRLLENPD